MVAIEGKEKIDFKKPSSVVAIEIFEFIWSYDGSSAYNLFMKIRLASVYFLNINNLCRVDSTYYIVLHTVPDFGNYELIFN